MFFINQDLVTQDNGQDNGVCRPETQSMMSESFWKRFEAIHI